MLFSLCIQLPGRSSYGWQSGVIELFSLSQGKTSTMLFSLSTETPEVQSDALREPYGC